MGDEIQTLRNRLRMSLVNERANVRQVHTNTRRQVHVQEEYQYTESQVIEIIHKVRKSGSVSVPELNTLKVYLSNKKNIPTLFQHLGALHGLVGILTGSDTCKQKHAAECICLLTLGSTANNLAIAKSAGVYLITFLVGSNLALAEICGMTVGNIGCSSPKAGDILREQGLMKTLINLLNSNEDLLRSTSIYALSQVLRMNPFIVTSDELCVIVEAVSDLTNCTLHNAKLLYILSSNGFALCPVFVEKKMFTRVVDKMVQIVSEKEWDVHYGIVVYLLRTAANVISDNDVMKNERDVLLRDDFVTIIRKLLVCQRPHVISNLLWFLGNVENHPKLTVDWKIKYLNNFSDLVALCI